jgi:hypothetical protein
MRFLSWLNFDPFNRIQPGKDKRYREDENLSIWEIGVTFKVFGDVYCE